MYVSRLARFPLPPESSVGCWTVAKGRRIAPKRFVGWERRFGNEKLEFVPEKGEPRRGGWVAGGARFDNGSAGCCTGWLDLNGSSMLAGETKRSSWCPKLVELNSKLGLEVELP